MAVLISLWTSVAWIGVLIMLTGIWLASVFVLTVSVVLAPGPAVVLAPGPAVVISLNHGVGVVSVDLNPADVVVIWALDPRRKQISCVIVIIQQHNNPGHMHA